MPGYFRKRSQFKNNSNTCVNLHQIPLRVNDNPKILVNQKLQALLPRQ